MQKTIAIRWRSFLGPMLVLSVLVGALWLLHLELRHYHLNDFLESMAAIPRNRLWLAIGLTVFNFVLLIGYDLLGMSYVRHPMNLHRVAIASFLSYAVGNSLGMVLGGSTIRYRLYSAWGLSAQEIVKLILLLSVTFWIGLFALAGFVFTAVPTPIPTRLHLPVQTTFPIGIVFASFAIGYLSVCAFRRAPLKVGQCEFTAPTFRFAMLQFAVAALDLVVAASVLYVLLPETVDPGFPTFLSIYLLSIVAAFLSQVPSGLGVIELVILVLLSPSNPNQVIGSLLAYRAIYYLFPFVVGILILLAHEAYSIRNAIVTSAQAVTKITNVVAPRFLAITIFLAGAMLLVSGATPSTPSRLVFLSRFLPLPVVEFSHFLNSILGLLLLLVARGLQRRVETAYFAATIMLGFGSVVSLLKGLDYEEALVLGAMLASLLPCRRHFYRHAALLTDRFSIQWMVAIAMVFISSAWLMIFAYKQLEYRNELWWQFAFDQSAPRSLRAMAGGLTFMLMFACWVLMRTHVRSPGLPTDADMQAARLIVEQSTQTTAHLAMLGDKRFLFNDQRTAMIMYGIQGRSWICLGDPIGDPIAAKELAWDFYEICDEGGRWPVYYQVDERCLPLYIEMGMTLIKLGEEAQVPLATFRLEGGARRGLRRTFKQVGEQGCTFEILEPPHNDERMTELKRISDAWLIDKSTAEKGFSLGFFEPNYIRNSPVAVVRQANKMIAFANILQSAHKVELSVDLMRFLPEAPPSTMEYLFTALMLWGHEQGYGHFNLGMAPLSGIEHQRLAPLWTNFAAMAYQHGENFYNFQGLRQYKEKFHPEWRAKYLASPGGFALPVILTNVATLISGGLRNLVSK